MKFEPRSNEVSDYDYKREIADGTYRAVVLNLKSKQTKNTAKEMLVLSFGVAGDKGGVRVDWHLVSPNQSTSFRKRLLSALGYEKFDESGGEFDPREWIGLECMVRVATKESQQFKDKRPDIEDMWPINGPNEPVRKFVPKPPPDEIEGNGDETVPF